MAQRAAVVIHRTDTVGDANPLTGLLFCADCGHRMYNHRHWNTTPKGKKYLLEESIAAGQQELDAYNEDTTRVDNFLELAGKYTDFTELTTPMIYEFVDKVLVHKPERIDGERVQEVEIYLNYIGKVEIPAPVLTPEELAAEEKAKRLRKQARDYYHRKKAKHQTQDTASGQATNKQRRYIPRHCLLQHV